MKNRFHQILSEMMYQKGSTGKIGKIKLKKQKNFSLKKIVITKVYP